MSAEQGNRSLPHEALPQMLSRRRFLTSLGVAALTLPLAGCVSTKNFEKEEESDVQAVTTQDFLGEGVVHEDFPGQPVVNGWDITLNANNILGKRGKWELMMDSQQTLGVISASEQDVMSARKAGSVLASVIEGTDVVTDYTFEVKKPNPDNPFVILQYFESEGDQKPSMQIEIPLGVSSFQQEGLPVRCITKNMTVDLKGVLMPEITESMQFGIKSDYDVYVIPEGEKRVRRDETPHIEVDQDGDVVIGGVNAHDAETLSQVAEETKIHIWDQILSEYQNASGHESINEAITKLEIRREDFYNSLFKIPASFIDFDNDSVSLYSYLLDIRSYPFVDTDGSSFVGSSLCEVMSSMESIFTNPLYVTEFLKRCKTLSYANSVIKKIDDIEYVYSQYDIAKLMANAYVSIRDSIRQLKPTIPDLSTQVREIFDYMIIFEKRIAGYPDFASLAPTPTHYPKLDALSDSH